MPARDIFAPTLPVGHTYAIEKADGVSHIEILAAGYLPHHRHDFGDITSQNNANDDPHLDMPDGELACYFFRVRGAFTVELTHPATTVRSWKTDSANFALAPMIGPVTDPEESEFLWHASQFWVYEAQTPRFDLVPLSSFATVRAHVDFYGHRYAFKKLPEGVKGKVTLRVNAWPAVG